MDLALIANELAVLEGRILRRPEQEEQEQPQRGCWKTDLNNEGRERAIVPHPQLINYSALVYDY